MPTVTYKELKSVSHIKQNIDFVESLLNKSFNRYGDNKFTTYCPFHNDTEDSFRVYVNKHGEIRFHCFGSCKGDWDIYDIIMRQKKCSFKEAQKEFAYYVGASEFQPYANQFISASVIPVEETEEQQIDIIEYVLEPEFQEVLQDTAVFYNRLLSDNPEDFEKIHSYLEMRGVDKDLIKKFNIGYSPAYQDKDCEGRALIQNKLELFHEDYLEFYNYNKSGLVRLLSDDTSPSSQYYRHYVDHSTYLGIFGEYGDFFAGRITFPVYDIHGNIQGIIGRRPDNRGKVRWIKQQVHDTCIRPASWLYGIDKAAAAIQHHKTVILVEGIFDYFAFYKLFQNKDMPCVVATLGTKLTDEGKRALLSAGVENFIVAYDWDDAGRYAIKRAAREVVGNVYYLGGMAENDDPAIRLKDVVHSISGFSLKHLMSAARNIQGKTEKPIFISHITTGNIAEREIMLKPDSCLGNDNLPSRTKKVKEYLYDADVFLPLLTYDHGNKTALDAKIDALTDMIETRATEVSGERTFTLPANFVEDYNYADLGPALILWLRIVIEQQKRKRKIREKDGTLASWLKTSRATIIKYKRILLEDGYLNADTSRKLQRLSVNYFLK